MWIWRNIMLTINKWNIQKFNRIIYKNWSYSIQDYLIKAKMQIILGAVQSVKIEEMFGKCWCLPGAAPPLPTIITVQAPAGIGKSSMLKYMCMKWGCHELWTDNFDIMLFVECRTLNRYNYNLNILILCKYNHYY